MWINYHVGDFVYLEDGKSGRIAYITKQPLRYGIETQDGLLWYTERAIKRKEN
jgi:hypothetical protein